MSHQRRAGFMFVGMLVMILVAVASTATLAQTKEMIDAAAHAGDTVAGMDTAQLLGTITVCSLALTAFLAYLLYKSQVYLWSKVITALEAVSTPHSKPGHGANADPV